MCHFRDARRLGRCDGPRRPTSATAPTTYRRALEAGEVICHPHVVGELAGGNLRNRDDILGFLRALPAAAVATDDEVLERGARC